jgi:hypothetical protein
LGCIQQDKQAQSEAHPSRFFPKKTTARIATNPSDF